MGGEAAHARLERSIEARGRARVMGRLIRVWATHAAVGLLVLGVVGAMLVQGLELRQWLWEVTQPIRFQGDIRNGFNQGLGVVLDAQQLLPRERRGAAPVPLRAFLSAYVDRYEVVENDLGRRRGC
jgi:hypothetical protein